MVLYVSVYGGLLLNGLSAYMPHLASRKLAITHGCSLCKPVGVSSGQQAMQMCLPGW